MNTELVAEATWQAAGRRLVVLDDDVEVDDDLVRDLVKVPDVVLRPLVRPLGTGEGPRRHGAGGGPAWLTSA